LFGEKEDFGEYSLNLEHAKLSFPILNDYLVERHRPCPRAMVHQITMFAMIHNNNKNLH
jgi:hypothetical protein